MKNHSFILAFLFLMTALNTFSQIRFQKGYIITNDGDTIYGELKNESNLNIYHYCVFKKDGVEKNFGPSSIKAYRYEDNRHFESQIIDTVFVEVLVSGKLSLYKYENSYYVQKNKEEVLLLQPGVTELMTVEIEQGYQRGYYEGVFDDNKWKGILRYLVQDCEKVYKKVQHIDFNQRNLVNLANEYNDIMGQSGSDQRKGLPWAKVQFGIEAGITNTSLDLDFLSNTYYHLERSYSSNNPSFGAILLIGFPRGTNHFGIQAEGNFTSSELISNIVKPNTLDTTFYLTKISLSTLNIPLMARYSFKIGNQDFYINGGLNLAIQQGSKALTSEFYKSNYGDEFNIHRYYTSFLITNSTVGYRLGCGYHKDFKNFSAELQFKYLGYQLNFGQFVTTAHKHLNVYNNSLSANLIILFGK
ncbi:MAG: PorT family protein [Bacteroidales bacterium]|nr:PorT family protein [Bacteroidales bacterium]